MNIDDFVCNGADRDTAMESLTKKELLSDSTGLPFIDRAWDEPDDDADTASVQSDTEQTTQEKMDAIRSVIFMLLEHQDIDVKLLRDLRKLQLRIRDQLRCEQDAKTTQTSITIFFSGKLKTIRSAKLKISYNIQQEYLGFTVSGIG
ncbi:hypothetical protein L915_03959 [Phytophthora nicotianae]|uniref:Uncharacterized protein n=1 Tax=Phytophthora nicotianae TaxID=4792 RepID=W2HBW6_PHYNI|nr:hypothetical protein L915_03959 [Phytophthora nicotianae]